MAKKPAYSAGPDLDDARVGVVRETLVSWFRENGRDLPWRRTRDPWSILVSEVMLQQIQVVRAIPFYERFLERFPTVESLAEAPIAEAIRVWGDLGRYRRVVSLHRTARIVVEEHGGEIPSDPEVLVKLPGIGPYTAGAVACFAFERDVSFFDTNMHRVVHRLFFGPDVPESTAKDRAISEVARALVPPGGGWEWNQALMEFGALRCTARKPACEVCPLRDSCRAYPEVLEALTNAPRRAKKEPGFRYEGSNRYYRGRVLARLREMPEGGISMRELGTSLREGFTEEDLPWLRDVVGSLEKDGLVKTSAGEERPLVVAEERAAYGSERPEAPPAAPAATRVSLP